MRRLQSAGHTNILTATRRELDLRDQSAVTDWFMANRPEYVYLVAGTVGGILANSTRPAEFLYDNLMIHGTVVEAARQFGTTKLLYLALRNLGVHWKPAIEWRAAYAQFSIFFAERLPTTIR